MDTDDEGTASKHFDPRGASSYRSALTPALSPEEKVRDGVFSFSEPHYRVYSRNKRGECLCIFDGVDRAPSLGGEGRGEGESSSHTKTFP